MLLALRVEVDSLAAANHALPSLLTALQTTGAEASFFINLGPDRAARSGGPLFQVGESKLQRQLNLKQAGPKGMARLYGLLMPAPQLHKEAKQALQSIAAAGFETGLLAWDRVSWVREIAGASEAWVEEELKAGLFAFEQLFGERAKGLALPQWRSNRAAFRLAQRLGFDYLSASRGSRPHLAVVEGEPVNLAQLPTTLPTLSELIGAEGCDEQGAVEHLLKLTQSVPLTGHVFTIQLSADGGKRLPLLAQLFAAWQAQGHELSSLGKLHRFQQRDALPWHAVQQQAWPGYQGLLTVQGVAFPN